MLNEHQEGLWSELRFEEAALAAFSFLVREYGLRCTNASVNAVFFASDRVSVRVCHDTQSFEIGVVVSPVVLAGSPEENFTLQEILRVSGATHAEKDAFVQATTRSGVARLVLQLAGILRQYGDGVLRADPAVFSALRAQQVRETQHFLTEGRLAFVRLKAAEAWRKRDYVRVVALLEEFRHALAGSEIAKLEYALRRISRERDDA